MIRARVEDNIEYVEDIYATVNTNLDDLIYYTTEDPFSDIDNSDWWSYGVYEDVDEYLESLNLTHMYYALNISYDDALEMVEEVLHIPAKKRKEKEIYNLSEINKSKVYRVTVPLKRTEISIPSNRKDAKKLQSKWLRERHVVEGSVDSVPGPFKKLIKQVGVYSDDNVYEFTRCIMLDYDCTHQELIQEAMDGHWSDSEFIEKEGVIIKIIKNT